MVGCAALQYIWLLQHHIFLLCFHLWMCIVFHNFEYLATCARQTSTMFSSLEQIRQGMIRLNRSFGSLTGHACLSQGRWRHTIVSSSHLITLRLYKPSYSLFTLLLHTTHLFSTFLKRVVHECMEIFYRRFNLHRNSVSVRIWLVLLLESRIQHSHFAWESSVGDRVFRQCFNTCTCHSCVRRAVDLLQD